MPDQRRLLRGRKPGHGRPEGGRPGRPEPRPSREPSRLRSAASSIKARPARPAASSPSPATARWRAEPSSDGWARARKVAEAALAGAVYAPVGYATHYHADYVVPYWASSLAKNMVVGAHIFYRWAGGWGRAPAFTQSYSGREPDARALRSAAMAAEAAQPAAPASVAEAVAEIPGAELKPIAGRQVSVRFKLAARKAVEETPHTAYVEKVQASDNLRWTLGAGAAADRPEAVGQGRPGCCGRWRRRPLAIDFRGRLSGISSDLRHFA